MAKNVNKLVLFLFIIGIIAGCAMEQTTEESTSAESEFSQFDKGADTVASNTETNSEDSLEKEINQTEEQKPANTDEAQEAKNGGDEFAEFEKQQEAPPEKKEEPPPPEVKPEPVPVVEQQQPPPPVVEEPKPVEPPPQPVVQAEPEAKPVTIQRLQFKGNDGGGTLAIEADGPLTFTTRTNPQTKQFIVEIPNSKLSKKAKRPLNTKDFPGGIGSVDPYQAKGSKVSRIVIQLREGAGEPVVQAEGNAILIVSGTPIAAPVEKQTMAKTEGVPAAKGEAAQAGEEELPEDPGVSQKILSSASLHEFLSGSQQFYGRKISLEANDMEVKEILKFISDESGVNLILNEDVRGKVSVRFKQVPWDQALVVLMQARKLGYVRQGQILRISKMADIKQEEEDYTKSVKNKQQVLPLQVKMIPISYAKVDDVAKQIQPFLTDRGKVIPETRTSAVVISDVDEALERIQKLITSLDVPPAQVLIEGKIVEATDTFQRFLGLNWTSSGDPVEMGNNSKGGAMRLNFGTNFGGNNGSSGGNSMSLSISSLDFLGNLTATLGLGESTGELRVLSSPRILTLHNEAAEINQQSELPLISANTGPTGAVSNSVTFKPVRLKLSVTPQVTNDASVIMAVDMTREFPGPVADRGTGARPINSRSAKTKVIVRNGQTAVIGGIYQSDSTDSESRVPGLGTIPVLGWLFKNHDSSRQKNELLIFLTPRIVGQADSGISAPAPLAPAPMKEPEAQQQGEELDL